MFKINGRKIGKGYPPYIIAELSANHGGNLNRAKMTIKAAKDAGADCVKIQTYTPDTMTLNSNKNDFLIKDGIWRGYSLYQLYQEAHTPYEWHHELFKYAKTLAITILSTPFDESAVDLLNSLDVPAYKIASFELVDLPLIKYVSLKGKPVLISTGMSKLDEIAEAVETCFKTGNKKILLFHCISSYPTLLTDAKLGDIKYISNYFNVEVGLSDHTTTNTAAIVAVSLGASVIEKHFKLDESECGPDSSFSILPSELSLLCTECNNTFKAINSDKLKRPNSENFNKRFRRSIYFVKDLKKGHILTSNDIKRVRPGFGLSPKYYDKIIGMKLIKDVSYADPVSWEMLENVL